MNQPDRSDSRIGRIELRCISDFEVNVLNKLVAFASKRYDDHLELSLQVKQSTFPPKDLDLVLQPKQGRELHIRVPFPAKGALLFNPDGQQIEFATPLYLGDLMGYQVRVLDGENSRHKYASLMFELMDEKIENLSLRELYIQTTITLDGQVNEFSVFDWMQPVESLLNISSSPDAQVKISLQACGHVYFQLYIRQFASLINPDYENGFVELSSRARKRLSAEEIAQIQVHAIYLQQPAQSDVVLQQQYSEQTALGKWSFQPEKREPGSWILYPSKTSKSIFRPILWNIGKTPYSIEIGSSLGKATGIQNPELREQAMRKILQLVASDFNHRGWLYISDLWDKTEHLPLETFDIWKIAVLVPEFMVGLFLQGYDDILCKINNELPLIWELIPLCVWRESFLAWRNKLLVILEYENDMMRELIEKKIRKMSELTLSLVGIEKILLLEILNKKSPEIQSIDSIFNWKINEELQSLLRRKANDKWPEQLSTRITKNLNETAFFSFLKTPNKFQNAVIFLPGVLAEGSIYGNHFLDTTSVTEIFKLKQIKEFDQDWFENAFQLLSVWLYQHKQAERTH